MDKYINLINKNWLKLSILPKLKSADIAKVKEPEKMYLYAFYCYIKKLNKYNLAQLSLKINDNGDNLMLLSIYIKKNNIKLIEYLESRGLDIFYKNKSNMTTYLCAILKGNIKLMNYFENRGINVYINYRRNPILSIFNEICKNTYEYCIALSYYIQIYDTNTYENNILKILKKINKNEIFNINYNYCKYSPNNKMRIFIIRQIKLRLNRFKITYI